MKLRSLKFAALAGTALFLGACEEKKDTTPKPMSGEMVTAILKGSPTDVKALLDKGEALDARQNGRTALHFAAMNNKVDVISALIARGAGVNALDDDNYTPLMVASMGGQIEAITALLNQGASIEAKDKTGVTSLHLAANGGKLEAVKLLIERGANLDARTNIGTNAIILAKNRYYNGVTNANDTALVEFLASKYGPAADTMKPTADGYKAEQAAATESKKPAKKK